MPLRIHGDLVFAEGDDKTLDDLANITTTLDILSDTDFDPNNAQHGDVLVYDATVSKWRLSSRLENLNLADLANVTVSALQDNDSLVFHAGLGKWVNSSYTANALQSFYGAPTGFQSVNWGGSMRAMNVCSYNGKAWAEILISKDPLETTPWTSRWIDTNNYLISHNLISNLALNYSTGLSSVLVTSEVTTNLLMTAKPTYTGGINSSKVINCSHLTNAQRDDFLDYFAGQKAGLELTDTFDLAGGSGLYDTHLGLRNATVQNDEWYLIDTVQGGSIEAPWYGYRTSGSYKSARAHGVDISSTNCLSIWVTNY